jgi:hypothetical protein
VHAEAYVETSSERADFGQLVPALLKLIAKLGARDICVIRRYIRTKAIHTDAEAMRVRQYFGDILEANAQMGVILPLSCIVSPNVYP